MGNTIYSFTYELIRIDKDRAIYRPTTQGTRMPDLGLPVRLLGHHTPRTHPTRIKISVEAHQDADYISVPRPVKPTRAQLTRRYPIGTFVMYEAKGTQYVGHVKRHSRKTMTILNEGIVTSDTDETVTWDEHPPGKKGWGWWRVPWSMVDTAVIDTVHV